jgi:hypothetical protein
LEYLAEILRENIDDESQKSLLEMLRVKVEPWPPSHKVPRLDKFMFCLESLVSLRGIEHVQITGLPDWYATCLQLAIQGQGGEVKEVDWPLIIVKRRKKSGTRRYTKYSVTSRKWYQPTLNWKEFAERNNVLVPEDIDKYWAFEH